MPSARVFLRALLLGLAVLVLLPVALAGLVLLTHPVLSVAPWRATLAQRLSAQLGRPVRLEGPLELEVGLRPRLRIGGLHLDNPAGYRHAQFASLGEAVLALDLADLWQHRLHVREFSARGVQVHLERDAAGVPDWLFHPPVAAPAAPARPASGGAMPAVGLGVDRVVFERLAVDYLADPEAPPKSFTLDTLELTAPAGKALAARLVGSVNGQFPYLLSLTGGSLDALAQAREPWPLSASLDFAGSSLALEGELRPGATGLGVHLRFGFGSGELRTLERLLQTHLPPVGAVGLSGTVDWSPGRLRLGELDGVVGRSQLHGTLEVDLRGKRPAVAGELDLPTFDSHPFLLGQPGAPHEAQGMDYARIEQLPVDLEPFGLLDARLVLRVERWLGLPGDIRDARLEVDVRDGALRAPVQATIAGVPLRGELQVQRRDGVPRLQVGLEARHTRLGGLAQLLAGLPGVEGTLEHFAVRVDSSGARVGQLVEHLDLALELDRAQLSYGHGEGQRPVSLRLDRFAAGMRPGQPLQAQARGALLGQDFSGSWRTGALAQVLRSERSPVELILRTGQGASLRLAGQVAAPGQGAGNDLRLSVQATRAGALSSWLGVSPAANARLALDGRLQMRAGSWDLTEWRLQAGRSRLGGEFHRSGGAHPLIRARLDAPLVDVPELESLMPPAKPHADAAGPSLDLPILPAGVDLSDTDLEVRVARVHLAATEVTGAAFNGRIRGGAMPAAPFSATIAEVGFVGAVGLDLRGQVPEATLWLGAEAVDIGALLARLHVADGLQARVDQLNLQLIGRGRRLGDMLQRSALVAELDGGALRVQLPGAGAALAIGLQRGRVEAAPGKALGVDLEGNLDGNAVHIGLTGPALPKLFQPGGEVPFALDARAAGTHLGLRGVVRLPVSRRAGSLDLEAGGEQLASLSPLVRVALPAWGPWSLSGRLVSGEQGYEVPDLRLQVGSSRLHGRGALGFPPRRPRLEATLTAEQIQLDDFRAPGPPGAPPAPPRPAPEAAAGTGERRSLEQMQAEARAQVERGEGLLSRQTLQRLDAQVEVAVQQVRSGRDALGGGQLSLSLQDGRLALAPARVEVPGGSAALWATYEALETGVEADLRIALDRFDYGILARRIRPDTQQGGIASLNFAVHGRAPHLADIMRNANGRVDFAVWPRELSSGVFDLWAVNLFVALVRATDKDKSKQPKVNCAVGRFALRDGVLTDEQILLDTSRMRVKGHGRVDFRTQALAVQMAPQSKTAQFFSLETPVEVSGTLSAPHIRVAGSEVLKTTARFLTSLFVVPVRRLVEGRVPREGEDVCNARIAFTR